MKTLKEVRKFLSGINNINSGGCGIAALAMIRWIRKNLNKEITNIYFIHTFLNPYVEENRRYINERKGVICAPSHVYISFGGKIFDVFEYELKKYMYNTMQFKSEEILINSINNIGTWNRFFDRKESIPVIEAYLDISLSDIVVE